jgi:hypothetical protein
VIVYKYPLQIGVTDLELPAGSKVVLVADDGSGVPHLWAAITKGSSHKRRFYLVATGQELPETVEHIGSFRAPGSDLTPNGIFVGHVFEATP